jgi:hypothetical protein
MSRPFYDRDGNSMDMVAFSERLMDVAYKHVAMTALEGDEMIEVSTVWVGIDHNFGDEGPPLIFETMVFGGPLDQQQWRWPNEEAALAGHEQVVELCRDAVAR